MRAIGLSHDGVEALRYEVFVGWKISARGPLSHSLKVLKESSYATALRARNIFYPSALT